MNAHIINCDIETTELEFRGKKYEVAFSLKVLNKLDKLADDVEDIESVTKIVTWLINDSIDREYILTGEKRDKVTEDEVSLFIGRSNLNYYKEIMRVAMGSSLPDEEKQQTENGDEIVITDEMIEEFGEPSKNATAE